MYKFFPERLRLSVRLRAKDGRVNLAVHTQRIARLMVYHALYIPLVL